MVKILNLIKAYVYQIDAASDTDRQILVYLLNQVDKQNQGSFQIPELKGTLLKTAKALRDAGVNSDQAVYSIADKVIEAQIKCLQK